MRSAERSHWNEGMGARAWAIGHGDEVIGTRLSGLGHGNESTVRKAWRLRETTEWAPRVKTTLRVSAATDILPEARCEKRRRWQSREGGRRWRGSDEEERRVLGMTPSPCTCSLLCLCFKDRSDSPSEAERRSGKRYARTSRTGSGQLHDDGEIQQNQTFRRFQKCDKQV